MIEIARARGGDLGKVSTFRKSHFMADNEQFSIAAQAARETCLNRLRRAPTILELLGPTNAEAAGRGGSPRRFMAHGKLTSRGGGLVVAGPLTALGHGLEHG